MKYNVTGKVIVLYVLLTYYYYTAATSCASIIIVGTYLLGQFCNLSNING